MLLNNLPADGRPGQSECSVSLVAYAADIDTLDA